MRRSAILRTARFAGCLLLAGCAAGRSSSIAPEPFDLAPSVRAVLERAAPAPPGRALRAYALTIHTAGAGPAGRVDVLGRHARLPDGALAAVTGSRAAGAFGMSRSLGLCGLVSLRLDTAMADRAWLPADPARARDMPFAEGPGQGVVARMRATELQVEGEPCAPRPGRAFVVALKARSDVAGQAMARGDALVETRYDCAAAPASEPASRLHPDLPGDLLRVECRRTSTQAGGSGLLAYAWIASGGVYLLTGHRGQDLAQAYVYTDVVLEP